MLALIAVVLVALAVLELYVLIQVGQAIGALNTMGVLLLVSLVGAWLAKREGIGVLTRLRRRADEGKMPTNELIDGALIVVGGLLLLLPGFVSDAAGLLLLFPPTRVPVRAFVRRRFRVRVYGIDVQRHFEELRRPPGDDPDVIDV